MFEREEYVYVNKPAITFTVLKAHIVAAIYYNKFSRGCPELSALLLFGSSDPAVF